MKHANLIHNKECLRLNFIPNHAEIRNNQKSKAAIRTNKETQILIITNEIQELYGITRNKTPQF